MSTIEETPEYKMVLAAVKQRGRALFVTGGAGRGKSVLISLIAARNENVALTSPYGIAAMNIKGQTVSSFFGIPFGCESVGQMPPLKKERAEVLRLVDIVVIDEASVLTPEGADMIDQRLRQANGVDAPFGLKTVVFVGDLFQTAPIPVKGYEQLGDRFFFNADVFHEISLETIELTKPFRQKDPAFSKLLDEIRIGVNIRDNLAFLNNKCYLDKQATREADGDMILVPQNKIAQEINQRRLAELKGESKTFDAIVSGVFGESQDGLLVPKVLELKVGARIIMLRNRRPLWSNGSTGEVLEILEDKIKVVLDEDGSEHLVERDLWEKVSYAGDGASKALPGVPEATPQKKSPDEKKEGKLERKVIGTFEQFPMALAWAMTIHKSQSLTLDEVAIDLSAGVHAAGMPYVALSRCRTLQGITLKSPLRISSVRISPVALKFYEDVVWKRSREKLTA